MGVFVAGPCARPGGATTAPVDAARGTRSRRQVPVRRSGGLPSQGLSAPRRLALCTTLPSVSISRAGRGPRRALPLAPWSARPCGQPTPVAGAFSIVKPLASWNSDPERVDDGGKDDARERGLAVKAWQLNPVRPASRRAGGSRDGSGGVRIPPSRYRRLQELVPGRHRPPRARVARRARGGSDRSAASARPLSRGPPRDRGTHARYRSVRRSG